VGGEKPAAKKKRNFLLNLGSGTRKKDRESQVVLTVQKGDQNKRKKKPTKKKKACPEDQHPISRKIKGEGVKVRK